MPIPENKISGNKKEGLLQNKNAIAACTKEERKIRNPEPFLSHSGPEKVPGFVHYFFMKLFCNSLFIFY